MFLFLNKTCVFFLLKCLAGKGRTGEGRGGAKKGRGEGGREGVKSGAGHRNEVLEEEERGGGKEGVIL